MNQALTFGYDKDLAAVMGLEKGVDISKMRLLTEDHTYKPSHSLLREYNVYQAGNKYYLTDGTDSYELYLTRQYFIDNEVNHHKKEMYFIYTPDNKHIYRVDLFKNDFYDWSISNIEARELPANESYIKPGDSCEYNGIKLSFNNAESISIEKNGVIKTLKVKEDQGYTYRFRKTMVYSTYGAYSIFAFMENIAEQAKINNRPFWHSSYMLMNQYFRGDDNNGS